MKIFAMNKQFAIVAGIMIVLMMGFVLKGMLFPKVEPDFQVVYPPTYGEAVNFKAIVNSKFISELGQPIEGIEPVMLLDLYPGLTPEDFDGVEALQGSYVYSNGEVKLKLNEPGPVHSAAGVISNNGYFTLLNNLLYRLESSLGGAVTMEEVVQLIESGYGHNDSYEPVACTKEAKQCPDGSAVGRTGPNCEFSECPSDSSTDVDSFEDCEAAGNMVMESYPRQCIHNGQHYTEEIQDTSLPLRYGEDVEKMEEYRADCSDRGGEFNECGSACGPEAETCFAVCSMICEVPEEDAPVSHSTVCSPESKLAQICTMEYAPVCGAVDIQCITTPCDPVEQTFSNGCSACGQGNVDSYTQGACDGDIYVN